MPAVERGTLLRELTPEAVETLLAVAGPSVELPIPVVEIRHLGGALAREPKEPNAVGGRDGAFNLLAIGLPGSDPGAVVAALGAVVDGGLTDQHARLRPDHDAPGLAGGDGAAAGRDPAGRGPGRPVPHRAGGSPLARVPPPHFCTELWNSPSWLFCHLN